MLTHAIEKGFSLKDVRVDFGVAKMQALVGMLNNYVDKYGYDDNLRVPISLVFAYQQFKEEHHVLTEELEELFAKVESIVKKRHFNKGDFVFAGTKEVKRQDMMNLGSVDFPTLAKNRHAIRNFANFTRGDLLEEIISEAINIAKYSPSACNRQAYRVHVYKGEEKTRILKAQGSAAPFSDGAEMAIIITGDMNRYYSFEQHLMYVDASLFAMSFMYVLTAKGVANIPLTQCIKRKALKRIRTEFKIPQNEIPVIMLAIGEYPEEMKVARSERMSYNDFTILH